MVFLAKAAEQSKREIRDNWFKKLQRNLTRYLLFSVSRPSKLLPHTLNDSDSHLLALSFVSMSSSPISCIKIDMVSFQAEVCSGLLPNVETCLMAAVKEKSATKRS